MTSPLRNMHNGERQSLESGKIHSDRPDTGASRLPKDENVSELESHLGNLSPSSTIFQQEGRVGHENRSRFDGICSDESQPHGEHSKTTITGRQASTQTSSPPPSYSESNTGIRMSNSSNGPQPSSQLEPEQPPGRYNAGVRALRSLALPPPSSQINGEQNCRSGGRYNAGVRVPRSHEEHSRRGETLSDRGPESSHQSEADEGMPNKRIVQ